MSEPLYKLTENFKALEKLADDPDMVESVVDTMEALEGEFNDKAIALVTVTKNMDSDIDGVKAEIARLTARKKAMENRKTHMLSYLLTNMEATGITKISCPIFSISYNAPKPMLAVDDEDAVPVDYIDISTVRKLDKKTLLSALKALPEGESIPGVHIGQSKASITIR